MIVAHVFLLKELVQHFETYLIKEKEYWLRSNIARVHQTSFQNGYLQELQKWSNETVARDPEKVFKSEGFTSLQENVLVSLVGRDDLQMDEVKIWKYVIEWGIAQIPGLSNNPKDWSSENILALKTILQNCLPLIHYFQISKDDINRSVQPYKQILDENLWKDITKKLKYPNGRITSKVLPPRKILTPLRATNEFSKVINEEDSAEIASWIDYKTRKYSVANNPYNFKLLLRGSRDGFTVKAFWRLCDNIKNLVVVIKVKGTDEVLGGYNPIGWSKPYSNIGGESGYCEDSFIFSLKNSTNQKSILSRVKYTDRAIYNSHHTGPCFGGDYIDTDDGTGSEFDLGIYADDECYCELSAYNELIKKDRKHESKSVSFEMEELEIFQIVKKS
ncbi:hypothetical protein C2G38_2129085 [Gigaspora rosea]|uniref:TLDc domain-containing protein n=1 Tax=Gigaspora rosea TaxID=44941 RepID=A0A397TVR3_9GLOM|nr:hypothetical protein C2G38_2129085 [Gigaspora rosea]